MTRLKDRHLEPGRGRVWFESGVWKSDYRNASGLCLSTWSENVAEAFHSIALLHAMGRLS